MQALRKLFELGKLELNHLYTEPPAIRNGGRDEGWFCREHALHSYFIARLLGLTAAIRTGHFAALLPEGGGITSFGTSSDHAWCIVGETRPVDLSIGFSYYREYPQLQSAVVGPGRNGGFDVEYTSDVDVFGSLFYAPRDVPRLYYLEQPFAQTAEDTLLDCPQTFFFPCDENSWLTRYGADVFSKVTLHVYKVICGDVKPLYTRMTSQRAFQYIRTHYPAAIPKLRKLLRVAARTDEQ